MLTLCNGKSPDELRHRFQEVFFLVDGSFLPGPYFTLHLSLRSRSAPMNVYALRQ